MDYYEREMMMFEEMGIDVINLSGCIVRDKYVSELSSEERKLYYDVKRIICEWDPEDLICQGASPGQYSPEYDTAFQILKGGGTDKELSRYLTYHFHYLFEDDLDESEMQKLMDGCETISKRLYGLMN